VAAPIDKIVLRPTISHGDHNFPKLRYDNSKSNSFHTIFNVESAVRSSAI